MTASTVVAVDRFGSGANVIAATTAPIITADSTPPRWSTGSVPSPTWLGSRRNARTRATRASGTVTRKGEPHQNLSRNSPDTSGPSAAIAPPRADQRAMDRVRFWPDHSAVMRASVVGNAIPAARPPTTRAPTRNQMSGAHAASMEAGMAIAVPMRSSSLRP